MGAIESSMALSSPVAGVAKKQQQQQQQQQEEQKQKKEPEFGDPGQDAAWSVHSAPSAYSVPSTGSTGADLRVTVTRAAQHEAVAKEKVAKEKAAAKERRREARRAARLARQEAAKQRMDEVDAMLAEELAMGGKHRPGMASGRGDAKELAPIPLAAAGTSSDAVRRAAEIDALIASELRAGSPLQAEQQQDHGWQGYSELARQAPMPGAAAQHADSTQPSRQEHEFTGEGPLGLGVRKFADGSFRIEKVAGVATALGITVGDTLLAIGQVELDPAMSKQEVVQTLRYMPRPFKATFSSAPEH